MRLFSALLAAPAVVALSGCGVLNLTEDRGFVEREWTSGIERLGLNLSAVYPPKEDVQVGDIYAAAIPCDGADDLAGRVRVVKLGTAPLVKERLDAYYGGRVRLADTALDNETAPTKYKAIEWQKPATGKQTFYGYSSVATAPMVAFPAFELAAGQLSKFSGLVPGNVFNVLFGFAHQSDVTLSIAVKAAETYELPAYPAIDGLRDFCLVGFNRCSAGSLKQVLEMRFGPVTCGQYVLIVNQVYVTRSLDYKYTYDSADAFTAALQSSTTTTTTTQTAGTAGVPAKTVSTTQTLLENQQAALATIKDPGGTLALSQYDNRSVTLSETFIRPLTFAYSGLSCSDVTAANLGCVAPTSKGSPVPPPILSAPPPPR